MALGPHWQLHRVFGFVPVITTLAPSSIKRFAVANLIPVVPPVITATLSFSLFATGSTPLCLCVTNLHTFKVPKKSRGPGDIVCHEIRYRHALQLGFEDFLETIIYFRQYLVHAPGHRARRGNVASVCLECRLGFHRQINVPQCDSRCRSDFFWTPVPK